MTSAPLRSYIQMVISQKVGVRTWFWYQIKAESVFLTMKPKTHSTLNATCSLFCGSASHICNNIRHYLQKIAPKRKVFKKTSLGENISKNKHPAL